ncbi:MAG: hypothetical protein ABIQ30_15275 [Devosia sp.]
MLGRASYSQDFIIACRKRAEKQLKLYDALAKKAGKEMGPFAPEFFNTMVLALDHYFMHRLRGKEGKDGNPLNEVRMLAASLLEHDGVMSADSTIKYDPRKSVTGIAIGEKIDIDRATFETLADGFFAEIANKFS